MGAIRELGRGKILFAGALAGMATLLAAGAALAISVLLPPGVTLGVPPTTAAAEPSLAGLVIHDTLLPFTITTPAGALVCAGRLQDRVVRSRRTGRLDFYYRIRDTSGPGAIGRLATSAFGGLPLRVAYRTDGLGTVPPRFAGRTGAPGEWVIFYLTDLPLSCAQHQESRFMLIRTPVTAFAAGGRTWIITTAGAGVSVPTVMP